MTTLPDLSRLSDDEFSRLLADKLQDQAVDRQTTQILYYQPSQPAAAKIHTTGAKLIGVGGGNRSGKSENCLARMVAEASGVFPQMYHKQYKKRFRGPINCRISLKSMSTHLEPVFLPKLRWWTWQGPDKPGGLRGHYGWIPQRCLIDGDWEKSWSEKYRRITINCLDPDDHSKILGRSTISFLSYDQDAVNHASGTVDILLLDEPPPLPIWSESKMRVLDVDGILMLAMTWDDDPGVNQEYIYDEVYEPGTSGRDKSVLWLELATLKNKTIDLKRAQEEYKKADAITRAVRFEGQPLRFTNRVHPLFTDRFDSWCFDCGDVRPIDGTRCAECGGIDYVEFNHVGDYEHDPQWPAVFLLDPHPRKPHMFCWVTVDPNDDYLVVAEAQLDGSPQDVAGMVFDIEERMNISTRMRIMDGNMGRSPSSGAQRGRSWEDDFAEAGLRCDMSDVSDVGRREINDYLKPDYRLRRPRLLANKRCVMLSSQFRRYVWDDYRRHLDRDQKQVPKDKHDDYPTLLKYLMNVRPTFRDLFDGWQVINRGKRRA